MTNDMKPIVECVPNFSEGREEEVIHQIVDVIQQTENVFILDIHSGKSTNRTVVTFAGFPEYVFRAAFLSIQKASELIDMSRHHGVHPRIGATDVCPFIPVSGVTDGACVELARELGERIGRELGIPVYMYGKAAWKSERASLPFIREGEYERLPQKLSDFKFKPDYGPALFRPKTGAVAVGVRDFMLAYNVNLNTKDEKIARKIASRIRESGSVKRGKAGKVIRDGQGNVVKVPGKLKFCQASGWLIEEYGHAQVTMNLHNYKITGLHTAFETIREEAEKYNLKVMGSELIGLTPKQAMIDAGLFYLQKEGRSVDLSEDEIIETAIESLGLNEIVPFDPDSKIIENAIEGKGKSLR